MKSFLAAFLLWAVTISVGRAEYAFIVVDSVLDAVEATESRIWIKFPGEWRIIDSNDGQSSKFQRQGGAFVIRKPETLAASEWKQICTDTEKLVGKRCSVRCVYPQEPLYMKGGRIIMELGVPTSVTISPPRPVG